AGGARAGTAPAGAGPGVAHFRRVWFLPTESFLHHLVTGCRRTRPLLVGFERDREDDYPVDCPPLALHPPGSLAARSSGLRARLGGARPRPGGARLHRAPPA